MSKEGMSDVQLIQGAATLLVDKLLSETKSTQGSITIAIQSNLDDPMRFYRVTAIELAESEVEHYQVPKTETQS